MAGNEPRKSRGFLLLGVLALGAAAWAGTRPVQESPQAAANWHGAMEFYRRIAVWAGRRAMQAEAKYWEAVG